MDLLLQCNQRLVTSGLDDALVLQQTLVQIVAVSSRVVIKMNRRLESASKEKNVNAQYARKS